MEFRVLGPLEVVDNGDPIALSGGRGRSLLALLIINAGQVLSMDRIIDVLWGSSPPPTVRTKLHGLVSSLRKSLAAAGGDDKARVLETHAAGYVLNVDAGQVDANRFRWLIEQSADTEAGVRARVLTEALDLWRGPALAEFAYELFAQAEIRELEELRLGATEERAESMIALGQHREALPQLENLIESNPMRERASGLLMKALYREGRQSEALDVYRRLRRSLVESLGVEPGPDLRGLEAAILRQDPILDPPAKGPVDSSEGDPGTHSWLPAGRRMVTVVFASISPDQQIADPERRAQVMRPTHGKAREIFEGHGGTTESFMGDVMAAVFGLPVAHEDDARRAIHAALELRDALGPRPEDQMQFGDITVRVGIATGEILVGRPGVGQPLASGDAVTTADALHRAADTGEVLIGELTRSMARSSIRVEAVDVRADVAAWRVEELTSQPRIDLPGLKSALIGRNRELELLDRILTEVGEQRVVRVVSIMGEAGIGKSSLAARFAATVSEGVTVLIGRCPPYGDTTRVTVRELIIGALGPEGHSRLVDLIGEQEGAAAAVRQMAAWAGFTDDEPDPRALFPSLVILIDSLTSRKPVVLMLDDLHWAEPTLLDLIDYLEINARGPLLVLRLARPEYLASDEARNGLVSPETIELSPFDREESLELVFNRAAQALPDAISQEITETARGNPLFIEQLVASFEDHSKLDTVPSVEALLGARLDGLGPGTLDLVRCAAVVGVDFSLPSLSAIAPIEARPFIERHMETLIHKQLMDSTDRPFLGSPGYSFRHILIQKAAYRSLLSPARSELHERLAFWLSDTGVEDADLDRMVGHHLERAYLDRQRLGLTDGHTLALAGSAGSRLAKAGIRSFSRMDAASAEDLLSRALELLPADDAQLADVEARLVEAHTVMGRHDKAEALLSKLLKGIAGQGDFHQEHLLTLERARIRLALGPDPVSLDSVGRTALEMLDFFQQTGDESGITQSLYLMTLIELRRGRPSRMLTNARRQLEHADRGGSAREKLGARWMVAMALEDGPIPVEECLPECEKLAVWRDTDCFGVLNVMAHLKAMTGKTQQAEELIKRARRVLSEQTRARRPLGLALRREAEIAIMAGDLDEGERALRHALKINISMQERDPTAQTAAILCRLLSRRDDPEASGFAALATEQAPSESRPANALAQMAQARAALAADDQRSAVQLAREAVDMLPLDMLNLSADLRVDFAEIMKGSREPDAAGSLAEEAAELYDRKGNFVGARFAHGLLRREESHLG